MTDLILPNRDEFEAQLEAEIARKSLLHFTKYTFPDYYVNWHHRLMCEKLHRFAMGEIRRLMIFMPPRHGKSELVSVRTSPYILGVNPDAQIILGCYSLDLAKHMNRQVQRVMDSPEYKILFPNTRIPDKGSRDGLRTAEEFEVIGHKGNFKVAGVSTGITGRGITHGIIDDPHKSRKEADSVVSRNTVSDFYNDFYTRQERDACILLTVTRWHEDDLAGRLLRSAEEGGEKWEVICFPAILEHLTNGDPREPGQALWPWKKDLEALEATKTAVGSRDWLSLYQQKPSPQGSGLFSREWFDIEDEVPKGITSSVRYWDLAATEPKHGTDPDWTVGLLLGRTHLNELYVLDIVRFRKRPKETREIIRKTAELDGRGTWIYIEQEPGSSGEYVTEGFTREVLFEYNVVGDKVSRQTGGKELRAHPVSAKAEARLIRMVRASWNLCFLDELEAFPNGVHDDQVDAFSGAFKAIIDIRPMAHPPELPPSEEALPGFVPKVSDRAFDGFVPNAPSRRNLFR